MIVIILGLLVASIAFSENLEFSVQSAKSFSQEILLDTLVISDSANNVSVIAGITLSSILLLIFRT